MSAAAAAALGFCLRLRGSDEEIAFSFDVSLLLGLPTGKGSI